MDKIIKSISFVMLMCGVALVAVVCTIGALIVELINTIREKK